MTSFFLLPDYPLSLMFRPSHLCIEVDSYKNVITNLRKRFVQFALRQRCTLGPGYPDSFAGTLVLPALKLTGPMVPAHFLPKSNLILGKNWYNLLLGNSVLWHRPT